MICTKGRAWEKRRVLNDQFGITRRKFYKLSEDELRELYLEFKTKATFERFLEILIETYR